MVIRRAADADLAGISACLADAFAPYRSEYSAGGFADTVLTIETARRRLEQMVILVADDHGSIVGIAPLLLEAAEAGLRAAGCTRVTLDTTRPLERAIAFYERRGYGPTGIVGDFYGMELIEYEKMLVG